MDSLAHRTNNVADENTVQIANTGCTKTAFAVSFILIKNVLLFNAPHHFFSFSGDEGEEEHVALPGYIPLLCPSRHMHTLPLVLPLGVETARVCAFLLLSFLLRRENSHTTHTKADAESEALISASEV
ncbi:hypothetical protein HPB48_007957 [Haemaphysalis longicornis]|uniref:Uncharacterized protein n=1 Tax=Haemaphysalis longicornis TaxID=44386 RepID=A0A9J6FLX0_HAELO|nr:hypothetical protein HPB48_007957 [Haemaphysalis longicornis]